MTKNKTKKTIMMSLVAMLICVAMLTGVTYALFQKSMTSASNIISVGVYNVEVKFADAYDAADGAWTPLTNQTGPAIFSYTGNNALTGGSEVAKYVKLTNNNSYAVTASITIPSLADADTLAAQLSVFTSNTANATNTAAAVDFTGTSIGKLTAVVSTPTPILNAVTIPAGESRIVGIGFKVDALSGEGATELTTGEFGINIVLTQA